MEVVTSGLKQHVKNELHMRTHHIYYERMNEFIKHMQTQL